VEKGSAIPGKIHPAVGEQHFLGDLCVDGLIPVMQAAVAEPIPEKD
jgi:hypothetical protein